MKSFLLGIGILIMLGIVGKHTGLLIAQQNTNPLIQSVITNVEIKQDQSDPLNTVLISIKGDPINQIQNYVVQHKEGTNNVLTIKMPNAIRDYEKYEESDTSKSNILKSWSFAEGLDDNEEFNVEFTFEANRAVKSRIIKNTANENEIVIAVNSVERQQPIEPIIPPELFQRDQEVQQDTEQSSAKQMVFNEDGSVSFVERFILRKPGAINVAIVNTNKNMSAATRLSIFLNDIKRSDLHKKLGIQLNVLQVSSDTTTSYKQTTLYFKKNYLKPSMVIAQAIAGDQKVSRMFDQSRKAGIDIEIYVGKDLE